MAGMARSAEELVQEWWRRADVGDLAPDLWAPDCVLHNPHDWPIAATYAGRDGLQQWWDDIVEAFQDIRLELAEIIPVDEERVLTSQRTRGRFRATGIEVDQAWFSIVTVRDGQIVQADGYLSRHEAMSAAGVQQQTPISPK